MKKFHRKTKKHRKIKKQKSLQKVSSSIRSNSSLKPCSSTTSPYSYFSSPQLTSNNEIIYTPLLSVSDTTSPYKIKLYSHSQSDIKSSKYSPINSDLQLGRSPSRFSNINENRSNSLPRTEVHNFPSETSGYTSNIDRIRFPDQIIPFFILINHVKMN